MFAKAREMQRWTVAFLSLLVNCGSPLSLEGIAHEQQETLAVQQESSHTEVIIINVGQGSSALVIAENGEAVLIDAGPEDHADAILRTLTEKNITTLKSVIATHYHEDHIGGFPQVLSAVENNGCIDHGDAHAPDHQSYVRYRVLCSGKRTTAHPGNVFELGEITLEVVATDGELLDQRQFPLEPFDENSASVALVITHHTTRIFIGGDITGGGGNPPYETIDLETPLGKLVGDIDVLVVNHHGSHTSSNEAFLDATTPEVAIISVGNDNDFFHPHPSVLNHLSERNIALYQTERGWNSTHDIAGTGTITIALFDDEYRISAETGSQ